MKKIIIQIDAAFRSLETGSKFELDGDLLILSGLNGSGKSHLADAIKGYYRRDQNERISRTMTIDGISCNPNQTILRTFSDAAGINDNDQTAAQLTTSHKEQVWNSYSQTRLDPDAQQNENFRFSTIKAKTILLETFTEDQFANGIITQRQISRHIPATFAWLPDDIFQNSVTQIFYSYAREDEFTHAQRDRGQTPLPLGKKPWELLNELFEKLDFGYRFRDDYQLLQSGELNYSVALHPVKRDGTTDHTIDRALAELSDGEKAIISLAYSSIGEINSAETKILVLDEFDAPLNPSLTKMLFEVVRTYFIDKGIAVLVVTHSPATIAMAPPEAVFYEMFRPGFTPTGSERVQRANPDDYAEMQLALHKYFNEIAKGKERLLELSAENSRLTSLAGAPPAGKKLQLISEGNNIAHIKKAIELLKPELLDTVALVIGVEGKSGDKQLKTAYEVNIASNTTDYFIYVWDVDAKNMVDALTTTANFTPFVFDANSSNTISLDATGEPCGIENLYSDSIFTDDVYKTTEVGIGYGGKKQVTEISKTKFLAKIQAITDASEFDNFQGLIDKLSTIIASTR